MKMASKAMKNDFFILIRIKSLGNKLNAIIGLFWINSNHGYFTKHDNTKTLPMAGHGDRIRNYPLKERYQQRKLPRDAGELPALYLKFALWFIKPIRGEIEWKSDITIKNAVCKVTKSEGAFTETEVPATKLSFTFENLKSLWHLLQVPLQQDFGVE